MSDKTEVHSEVGSLRGLLKTLRGIDVEGAMMGLNIENLTAKQALLDAKDKHARR